MAIHYNSSVCVFVSRLTSTEGGGGSGGTGGVATWTTLPVVEEKVLVVVTTDTEVTTGIPTNWGHAGSEGGIKSDEKGSLNSQETIAEPFIKLTNTGQEDKVGGEARAAAEEEEEFNNLYYPLYYGDSHIKVGHPFAITCILTQTEEVQWLRDGHIIETKDISTARRKRRVAADETETLPQRMENQINWNIDGGLARTLNGEEQEQRKVGGWQEAFEQFLEQQQQQQGQEHSGDESMSAAAADATEWDWGIGTFYEEENENDDLLLEELWRDMLSSGAAAAAPDGRQLERRLKRNVSELEQFKLRQYYNALVNYKNQGGGGGGGGYFMDTFLRRSTNKRITLEQQKLVDNEATDEYLQEKATSVHDYVFAQGQVQVLDCLFASSSVHLP